MAGRDEEGHIGCTLYSTEFVSPEATCSLVTRYRQKSSVILIVMLWDIVVPGSRLAIAAPTVAAALGPIARFLKVKLKGMAHTGPAAAMGHAMGPAAAEPCMMNTNTCYILICETRP